MLEKKPRKTTYNIRMQVKRIEIFLKKIEKRYQDTYTG